MIYGAILAGGKGLRLGNTSIPKQFLNLGGKPVIIQTLEKMLSVTQIDRIYIGCLPDWVVHCNDLINKYLEYGKNRIYVVEGGATRNETILSVIKAISETFPISDDDILITHDSVRPFVTTGILLASIEKAIEYGASDTVIKSYDTIIRSTNGNTIDEVPDRSHLYSGQTPQSFKINLFIECYNSLSDDQKDILTDACKILVLSGKPVAMVAGIDSNMKITTSFDLEMAEMLIDKGAAYDKSRI